MTKFRPCIDLHEGRVKQIVGGTLDAEGESLQTNFVSEQPAAHFARLYREDGLCGGHVIMLGQGNEPAAREALAAYPGGLQLGGGITVENAASWLEAGASHVIATSSLFDRQGHFQKCELDRLEREVGRGRLVLDLSCRRDGDAWVVAMDRWQTKTDLWVTVETLAELSTSCAEFLVHAADVEGRCEGIDENLVRLLGSWGGCPVTYAGGVRSLGDLATVDRLSLGRVDVTVGSALDIFGGSLVKYVDCVEYNRRDQGA
jgi:phosphoribosylformimino-5-aminoimidazole carboxamide ribotide isomerase